MQSGEIEMKKPLYQVPDKKKMRVVIDTDANCECDDQYAIVHALLSPKIEVRGVIAEHYGDEEPDTMLQSYHEIQKVCRLGGFDEGLAYKGVGHALLDEETGGEAEGVDFLIGEAMREDERPLFVLCQGALSNAASAILKKPEICSRMLLVIVGGCNYPAGGFEFNTMNDRHAFNVVMNHSVPVWMLPEEVYGTMHVGFYELQEKVFPFGRIGAYLVEHTFETVGRMLKKVPDFSKEAPYDYAVGFPNGESWSLGDSAGVGVLLSHHSGTYREVAAPNVKADGTYTIREDAKTIRWYTDINQRLILEDFFAKMKYYFIDASPSA